jgi:hypothetical protein
MPPPISTTLTPLLYKPSLNLTQSPTSDLIHSCEPGIAHYEAFDVCWIYCWKHNWVACWYFPSPQFKVVTTLILWKRHVLSLLSLAIQVSGRVRQCSPRWFQVSSLLLRSSHLPFTNSAMNESVYGGQITMKYRRDKEVSNVQVPIW